LGGKEREAPGKTGVKNTDWYKKEARVVTYLIRQQNEINVKKLHGDGWLLLCKS